MNFKQFIQSLFFATITIFAFNACSDVPSPYDIPGQGESSSIYGEGTLESPYSIKGAALNQNGGYAWVKAYIVGYIPTGDDISSTISDIKFTAEGAGASNLVISLDPNDQNINSCMAVQLPSGSDIRTALNLQDHPENIGKEVMLYGTMSKYFGAAGVKDVKAAVLDGNNIGDMPVEPTEALFSEKFETGMGEFTIDNIEVPAEMGVEVWTHDASYKYMKATSHIGGADGTDYKVESWLVSPVISLKQAQAATLTFDHAGNYFSTEPIKEAVTVWAREAGTTTWTQLNVPTYPAGNNWTFVSSGDVDLNAYKGKDIQIGFKYVCKVKSGTYELKNILIEERNASTTPVGPTGENLLTNGGFETWTDGVATGWKSSNSASNANVTQSNDAKTGNYSAMLEGTTASNKRMASEEMTLKAGTYKITAMVKAVDANASIRLGYAINEADGSIAGGDSYKYGSYINDITKDEWQEVSHEFTLAADTKLNLIVFNGKKPGQSVLIDDYSLTTADGGIIEGEGGGDTEEPETPGDAVLSESFKTSFGQFTASSVTGEQAWEIDTQYGFVKMSAYASGTSLENEDWLISPSFDLSQARTLTFQQAFGPYNMDEYLAEASRLYTVWVSTDYTKDAGVAQATWTQVNINYPATSGWEASDATAQLPAIGNKAYLAFKYKNANGDNTLTWEIRNVVVK